MDEFEKWGLSGDDAQNLELPHGYAEGTEINGELYRATLFDNIVREKGKKDARSTRGQDWGQVGGTLVVDRASHEHELVHRLLKQERGADRPCSQTFIDAVEEKLPSGLPEDTKVITDADLAEKYDTDVDNTWTVLAPTDETYEKITLAGEAVFWDPIRPHYVQGVPWDDLDIDQLYSRGIDEFLSHYLTEDDTSVNETHYGIDTYNVEDALRRLDASVEYSVPNLVATFAEFESKDKLFDYCFSQPPVNYQHVDRLNGSLYGDKHQTRLSEWTDR